MGELSFEGGSPFDLPGVTKVEVTTYGSRVVLNLHLPGDGSVTNRERVVTVPMRGATALALGRDLAAITEDLDLDEKLPHPIYPPRADPKLPPDDG